VTVPGGYRDRLVVATSNPGKLEELRVLLAGLFAAHAPASPRHRSVEVVSVAQALRNPPATVEDGETFAENAVKKASAVAQATLMLTVADDSGLEVDALGGRPGVRSARFAHARATDSENNAALLAALDALGDPMGAGDSGMNEGFRARFHCVLALVDPFTHGGQPRVVDGVCEGTITRTPRGSGGFGYDPLFVVAGSDKTMAELAEGEKNRISHRARALAALRPLLEQALDERASQLAR
jgi:XTP/dITP diphosphohydrolase